MSFAQKSNTKSPHGPLTIPCENCHTAQAWRPIRPVPEFDHNKTAYPLRGLHEKVKCVECHVKPVFTDVGKNCADCHADIHRRKFGADCAQCHTVLGWQVSVNQIKEHQNRFPLLGAHAAAQCEDCHKSAAVGQFEGLSTACVSCHLTDYQKTNNPPHAANTAVFTTTCDMCHSFDSWLNAKFDHTTTGFLLTNGHANVLCLSCHVGNNYHLTIAPTDCGNSGCHLTTWQNTNNPAHPSAGSAFAAANCSMCHNTTSWNNAIFNHATTGFPLTNGHANVACSSCHINNNYNLQISPSACGTAGCHLTTWQQTTNPAHMSAGPAFALANCANCHTTAGWDQANFNHASTGFPLTNGHAGVACASCHINNNYNLMIQPTDCGNAQCHLTTWQGTNNPTHSSSGPAFAAANCANCHTTAGWDAASFDHSVTGFALVGTHLSTPCASCHVNNNYSLNSADCYGCHAAAFQSTTTIGGNVPNHVTAGFPQTATQCASCHPITTWSAGMFNHSTTGFPLTAQHTSVQCSACHINGNYSLQIQPTDCGNAQCHLTTWQGTNNPVHSTAGTAFAAANCSNCHTTAGWDAASFDHSVTGFTLVGTHLTTPCASCHVNNNYSLTSADCYGCHAASFQSTTTIGGNVPNHVAAGFPQTAAQCASCHPITTWSAGMFNHSTTGFPLTGTHVTTPCGSCHVNNNYSGTLPTDCYSCHITAWQSTFTLGGPVPNHMAANFSTNCATSGCHNTTSWLGVNYNHTFWQLPHHGANCNDCHINQTTYASESCINCHTTPHHDKTSTDSIHKGKSGYSYGPMTCIAAGCHPNGAGGG